VERIYAFLPSIVTLACIAVTTRLYLWWVVKRFGKNFKSVNWHKKNELRVVSMFGTPLVYVFAPALEELIFRAPIIVAFSTVSSVAWYGIFVSSGLFALAHWRGKKVWMSEILSGNHKSDDVAEEMNRFHAEAGKMIMARKAFQVTVTLFLGILAGYYGIKYQSIWVAFGIHVAWNIVAPTAFIVLVYLGLFVSLVISTLWNKVRWKWGRSW